MNMRSPDARRLLLVGALILLCAGVAGTAEPASAREAVEVIANPKATRQQRSEAARYFREHAKEGEAVIGDLIDLMRAPKKTRNSYRYDVRAALHFIGPPAVKAMLEALADEATADEMKMYLHTYWQYRGRKGGTALIAQGLNNDNPAVRARTAEVLARIGPDAAGVTTALIERLQDDSARVRRAAGTALEKIGPEAAAAIAPLVQSLTNTDEGTRWHAARALGSMGAKAVPALIGALRAPAASSRRYAGFALAKIGPGAAPAMASLAQALKDREPLVRRNAADALGRLGTTETAALLMPALKDTSPEVQVVAAASLEAISADDPAVKRALEGFGAARRTATRKAEVRPFAAEQHDGGLFPCRPVPGYPGADNNERPAWGWPERLPYKGSVEHVRTMIQKYLPAVPLFDADSLVHNFRAWELPDVTAARVRTFAEPVYYVPMYGAASATGEKRPAVKVLRWRPGSPSLKLALGPLKPGYYAVRVIAAIETGDVQPSPKPAVMCFRVNDRPGGGVSTATRRVRAVDNFYSIAEWYFRAWDGRDFNVELTLVEGTETEFLVHNVDVHDLFAHLPRRAAKRGPYMFTVAERAADRREFAARATTKEYRESFGRAHGSRPPTRPLRNFRPTPEERARLDAEIWSGLPPMNTQYNDSYGKMNRATPEEVAAAKARGAEDPGWGVYFPGTQNYWTPKADALTGRRRAYQYKITPMDGSHPAASAVLRYHFAGDREAARDTALKLCRIACLAPTWDMRHSIQNVVCRPDQCWGREQSLRRRVAKTWCYRPVMLMHVYDMLFDYIEGNEELAVAVGRFIPGIHTAGDLRRFLDTNILQFHGNLIYRYRIYSDHESPIKMLTCATIQGDAEITGPWMEWLWTRTWDYPQPLSGVPDQLNTATSRDGTTYIGSWFYTAAGGRGMDMAVMVKRYIDAGGDRRYNLLDFRRYPKILTSCCWTIEGRVAGLWPMQIGDVNGPTVPHGHWFNSADLGVRLGWKWTKDPKFAYPLKYIFGRKGEGAADWRAVEDAAAKQRNPWFANRSRALSAWAGVLESGVEHDDFRFRRALTVRVGNGWGHAHSDTLDLNIFAHGCVMAADGGQRPGYGHPECYASFTHNVVEVDGDGHQRGKGNWRGHGWIRTLADAPGAGFVLAESVPPENHPEVSLFRRHLALIDVDEGRPSAEPITNDMMKPNGKLPTDVITPSSYVFDVFRVVGGKMHTYCFHGGQNDDLKHNARNVQPLDAGGSEFEKSYLRKFDIGPERRWVGDGVDTFVADFRLSRDRTAFTHEGKTYNVRGAEPANLGPSFDPAAPRKVTRLHVLGQAGGRFLGGTWFNAPYTQRRAIVNWFDCVFVQKRREQDGLESAFVALIEPYAGEPFIACRRLLDVTGNETDARRAVAVEVTIKADAAVERPTRTDILFADGRPEEVRQVGGARMSGEFAMLSRDDVGLRQAVLVGGTTLSAADVSLTLKTRRYETMIERVDYLERTARLQEPLPALLDGSFFEVGNADHRTSLEITRVEGRVVRFRKGVELATTRVISVDEEKGIVRAGLGLPVLGLEKRVEGTLLQTPMPGMAAGLAAGNEDRTRVFRCDFLGGSPQAGYDYRLKGGPVRAADFPKQSALRIYEFGRGDTLALTGFASLRRLAPGTYELVANGAVSVGLKGKAVEISRDGKDWRPLAGAQRGGLATVDVTAKMLGGGRTFLRLH